MFYCEKLDKISVEEFISIINQYMQWYRDKRIKLSLGGESDGVDAVLELLNLGPRKRPHPQGHTEIARSELRTAKNHLLEEDYELLANRLAVEANMM